MPDPRVVGTGAVRGTGAVAGAVAAPPEVRGAEKLRGGKKILVALMSVVACFALVAVGIVATQWLPFGGGSPDETRSEPAAEAVAGKPVEVEAVSINLAKGHYLRIGYTMLVEEGAGDLEIAPAKDLTIDLFSGRPLDEVNDENMRVKLKTQLLASLNEAFDGQVIDLFYTDYVTQ